MRDVRKITDFKDMLNQSVDLFGDRVAFCLKTGEDTHKNITYNKFNDDVNFFGTALLRLGLKGEKIAVISENRYEWCVTYLSAAIGVGVIVPFDASLPENEILNLIERSEAKVLVYSQKMASKIEKIRSKTDKVQYFIDMDINVNKDRSVLSFYKLLEDGKKSISEGYDEFLKIIPDPNKMSVLLFTSGTTDKAKGVMLSQKNICSDTMAVCKVLYLDENDVYLSILPMHHTYECTCGFILMVYNGVTTYFCEGLKYIAKNIKEYKPTLLMLVPLIVENLYKKVWESVSKNTFKKYLFINMLNISDFLLKNFRIDVRRKFFNKVHENVGGRLRLVITGAAAVAPEVVSGFDAMGITVRQGYGLTETAPIVSVNAIEKHKSDSIGIILPCNKVKIMDPDESGIGEIAVKGDNVMLGYYLDEENTKKVFNNGWFLTGDLGKLDNEGFLYITGRNKNVIITKNGKNVYPEEIETLLLKSPLIKECIIYSIEDNAKDILIFANILPDRDYIKQKYKEEGPIEEHIEKIIGNEIKRINHNLSSFKKIQKFNLRENEFVKTTTQKIKRYEKENIEYESGDVKVIV